MARRKYLVFGILFLSALLIQSTRTTQAQSGSNRLAAIAASMQPGTFALLNQENDGSGYNRNLIDGMSPAGLGVGSIFGFAQKAVYDPVQDRVHFSGGAHDGQTETIHYDVATNRWTND